MSRHRHIRNLKLEDEMDREEDMDYGDEEEEEISAESAQYIYQRDGEQEQSAEAIGQSEANKDQQQAEGEEWDQQDVAEEPICQAKNEPKQIKSKAVKAMPPIRSPQKKPNVHSSEKASISESQSPAPSKNPTKKPALSNLHLALETPPRYKTREKPLDATQSLNLVIVGHVDAGKSTLVGHLLYLLGNVDDRLMHKYRQESSRSGKGSFAFAWILDEFEEERARGVTMDLANASFESPSGRNFNILDAPGHKDFIPNMINGASQADAALLVVNATRGEFETGLDQGGQTREHALLIRALGVSRVVVAVNKLDTIEWSKDRYEQIRDVMSSFLIRRAGFESASFVPISGLLGINLVIKPPPDNSLAIWYQGPTLIETLDDLNLPDRQDQHCLRIVVNDVLRSVPQSLTLSGKVASGHVESGDKLWLMPDAIPTTVKSISRTDTARSGEKGQPNEQVFFAGTQITLTLSGSFEPDTIFPGHVLCRSGKELLVPSHRFRAKLVTFDIRMPIIKGTHAELFIHSLRISCVFCRLLSIHSGFKGMEQRNPRFVPGNVTGAVVEIRTQVPICVESFAANKSLGRLALRADGATIAAGIVEECFPN